MVDIIDILPFISNPSRLYYEIFAAGDPLSAMDHHDLFTYYWNSSRAHEQGIRIPDWLRENIVENRMLFQNYFLIATGSPTFTHFQKMNDLFDMEASQERELWGLFHDIFPEYSHRTIYQVEERLGILDIVNRQLNGRESVYVLDVGCGPEGTSIEDLCEMYGGSVKGIGIDKRIKNKSSIARLEEGCATAMNIPDGSIDVAYSVNVLPYLTENMKTMAIAETMRVLADGGVFAFTDSDVDIWSLQDLASGFTATSRDDGYVIIK